MKLPLNLWSVIVGLAAVGGLPGGAALARSAELATAQADELPPYLQCVPYAREVSGIQIYGDAHTWWDQAAGKYRRGNAPRVGAVMAFVPTQRMQLGHVATVVKVIDRRTVLLDHANWSPVNGRRGQIERGVKAVDVSARGDWSEVRVWYAPLQDLGTTHWPVAGFIYADGSPDRPKLETRFAAAATPASQALPSKPTAARPAHDFDKAFAALGEPSRPVPVRRQPVAAPQPAPRSDPFAAVLAQYD